jgi:hypothetical protein
MGDQCTPTTRLTIGPSKATSSPAGKAGYGSTYTMHNAHTLYTMHIYYTQCTSTIHNARYAILIHSYARCVSSGRWAEVFSMLQTRRVGTVVLSARDSRALCMEWIGTHYYPLMHYALLSTHTLSNHTLGMLPSLYTHTLIHPLLGMLPSLLWLVSHTLSTHTLMHYTLIHCTLGMLPSLLWPVSHLPTHALRLLDYLRQIQ